MHIYILLSCFLLLTSFVFAETITLSTYYPAPQGSYNQMKIKDTWCAGTPCFTPTSTALDATFTLHGQATFNGATTFNGEATFNKKTSFNEEIVFKKTLSVDALAKFNKNVEIKDKLTITALNTTSTALKATGRIEANAFFHTSDQRLKEHIVPIDKALEKTLALEGVSYNWKENPNQKKIGLIAQQVEKILPEVVITNEQGFKSIAYAEIIGLLVEAIKEQQKQIDFLTKQLNYEK